MSQIEEDYQNHLTSMLIGPDIIYSVMVLYTDNTSRLYTFSDEDSQVSYVEYLQEAGEDLGMVSATLFESTLDYTDLEYEYFNKIH